MPCRSDYMEPTHKERLLQETAQLTVYVLDSRGEDVPVRLVNAAHDIYCREDYVPLLCSLMKEIETDVALMDKIVYNGRSKMSRRLADWWGKHKEADRKRIAEEQADARRQNRYEQIVMNLSDEDIAVLKDVWGVN